MDSNNILQDIRNMCDSWVNWGNLDNDPVELLNNLVDRITDLDQYLSEGNRVPNDWS